jgi:transcriptional regulator
MMYVPAHFEEKRVDVLHQLIRERPLAALVTLNADGLNANHIPFEIDAEPGPFGTLRGHVARANPVWRSFSPAVESLAIFSGPQAYVSPSWYPSKADTGEVVPTYNYVIAHVYGPLTIIHDREWLGKLVNRLTERFESGRTTPWHVTDAPAPFIERQLGAIVGIEIPITRLIGKLKVSQNRPRADREGAARGLSESSDADSLSIAQWIKDKSET